MTGHPYTYSQAAAAARQASLAQQCAEDAVKNAAREFAKKEEAYRIALAKEIVTQHDGGVAWSVAPDLARGDTTVAALRRDRDIAEGVREAMQQACWRRVADRKDTQRFIDWSMKRELAEGYGQTPEPEFEPPIGVTR